MQARKPTGNFIDCHSEVVQHHENILLVLCLKSGSSKSISSLRSLSSNIKIPKCYQNIYKFYSSKYILQYVPQIYIYKQVKTKQRERE